MAQLKDTTVNGNLEVAGETNLLSKVTSDTRQNINYIGINPILNTDEDTTENWMAFGSGHAYFGSSILQSQPATYGFLENIVCDTNIHQVFTSWTSGTTNRKWVRTGNLNYPLDGDWIQLINENYPQYIKIYKTTDTEDYSTSYNYFDPFNRGTTTSIIRGNLSAGSYTFSTFGDRTDYTAYGIYIGPDIRTIRISYSIRFLNTSDTNLYINAGLYRLRDGVSSLVASQSTTRDYGRLSLGASSISLTQEEDFYFIQCYRSSKAAQVNVISGSSTQIAIDVLR